MFRTVPLSIIRSFSLYTQQRYMSYRFADSLRAGSGRNCSSFLPSSLPPSPFFPPSSLPHSFIPPSLPPTLPSFLPPFLPSSLPSSIPFFLSSFLPPYHPPSLLRRALSVTYIESNKITVHVKVQPRTGDEDPEGSTGIALLFLQPLR